MSFIQVNPRGDGFVNAGTSERFVPIGVNYSAMLDVVNYRGKPRRFTQLFGVDNETEPDGLAEAAKHLKKLGDLDTLRKAWGGLSGVAFTLFDDAPIPPRNVGACLGIDRVVMGRRDELPDDPWAGSTWRYDWRIFLEHIGARRVHREVGILRNAGAKQMLTVGANEIMGRMYTSLGKPVSIEECGWHGPGHAEFASVDMGAAVSQDPARRCQGQGDRRARHETDAHGRLVP